MDTTNLKGKLKTAKDKVAEVSEATTGKISDLLEEYRKALDVLEAFGFKVRDFQADVSLLPKVQTSVSGAIDKVQTEKIDQMIKQNDEKKLFCAILNAVLTAKQFKSIVELKSFGVVLLDITLGIPPRISINFQDQ